MQRIGLVVVAVLAGLMLVGLFFWPVPKSGQSETASPTQVVQEVETPFTARFKIVTHGLEREFTASMYLNQSSRAYLTAGDPGVVMVAEAGITWGEFFDTLPFSLNAQCLITGTGQELCDGEGGALRFFLNGQESSKALELPIAPGDALGVMYGNETEEEIQKLLFEN